MYPEANYLVFAHFGITEQDNTRTKIQKISDVSYQDFCRRAFFQNGTPFDMRDKLKKQTTLLLCDRIPALLKATKDAQYGNGPKNGKTVFDEMHHEICEDLIRIYEPVGGQAYGVAQRWLNLTLMNLAVVGSILLDEKFPVLKARKYFHVPVDPYLLEVATSKSNKFEYGLKLKCAPQWHDTEEPYQMDWFRPGETQPYEFWGYPEYKEFQSAVYNRVRGVDIPSEPESFYQDGIDWAFRAYVEGKRARGM